MSEHAAAAVKPIPNRKRGKKSDPRFGPVTLWLEREVYLDARRHVVGTDLDVSAVVTRLLASWIKEQSRRTRKKVSGA